MKKEMVNFSRYLHCSLPPSSAEIFGVRIIGFLAGLMLVFFISAATASAESLEMEPVTAEATQALPDAELHSPEDIQETEITSDQGSMDFGAGLATFKGNVKVVDQDAVLTSDELIVHFNNENQVETMEAHGNVIIRQPRHDRVARAGYVHYTAENRVVILQENPSLQAGRNVLRDAAKIIYYMDSERITTEPGEGERTTVVIPHSSSRENEVPLPRQEEEGTGGGK